MDDKAILGAVVQAHKEFIGEEVSSPQFRYESTGWHSDKCQKAGINCATAGIFSGLLPEDWRRDEGLQPESVKTLDDMRRLTTGYAWEGM